MKSKQIISSFVYNNQLISMFFRKIRKCSIKGRKGNTIKLIGAQLKNTKIIIKGNNNLIEVRHGTKLNDCTLNITGNNCRFLVGENGTYKDMRFVIFDDGSSIEIGRATSMWSSSVYSLEGKSIKIGIDCAVSSLCEIRNSDSHSIINNGVRINGAKDVSIADHVWICHRVTVLKGVIIPSDCVIGAGTLVTKSVEFPKSLIIMKDGRQTIIKENINWDRNRL